MAPQSVARKIASEKVRRKKGMLEVTPELRREWSSRGGRRVQSPGYMIDRLTLALPGLPAEERRRLIALIRVAEAVEAAEAAEAARDQA